MALKGAPLAQADLSSGKNSALAAEETWLAGDECNLLETIAQCHE